MAAVTPTADAAAMRAIRKVFEGCKVVQVDLTGVDDADTLAVGPGLLSCGMLETGAASSAEVGASYDRSTNLITFDTASSGIAFSLLLFYGASS